MKTYWGVEV